MMREFNVTHHLSELTTDWGILAAGAASFGEKLQVSFPEVIILLGLLGSYALSLSSSYLINLSLGTMPTSFSWLRPSKSYPPKLVL
jgi:hypothetical protein